MAERTRCEECNMNFPSPTALEMHNSAKHPAPASQKKSFNKKPLMTIAVIAIIIAAGIFFFYPSDEGINGNIVSGETQKISLGMKGGYYPNTITVKAGIPVELTLDSTVRGCYRSFKIPELGVSKFSATPENTIIFTPTKKGRFGFQCSMGMGRGTIIVE